MIARSRLGKKTPIYVRMYMSLTVLLASTIYIRTTEPSSARQTTPPIARHRINPFSTALPYVGTKHSNYKYFVPKTGLGS